MAGKVQDLRFQIEQRPTQIPGGGRQPHCHLKVVSLARSAQRFLNLFHLFIQAQRLRFHRIRRYYQDANQLSRLRLPLCNADLKVSHNYCAVLNAQSSPQS